MSKQTSLTSSAQAQGNNSPASSSSSTSTTSAGTSSSSGSSNSSTGGGASASNSSNGGNSPANSVPPPQFMAGIAHVAGNYGFTQENYLLEGAQKIQQLGSQSIFIYLTPWFRAQYPDQGWQSWPKSDPADLSGLAQTDPYSNALALNFKTIVLSAYTFANADRVQGIANDTGRLQAEETEFYNLTKYLYWKFADTGKTFILKSWEGDWMALGQQQDTNSDISDAAAQDMIAWLRARQRGVSRARNEVGSGAAVLVMNAAEVNLVLDQAQQGLKRVIDQVIPQVNADMVTYSSYDSTAIGSDAPTVQHALTQALHTIEKYAPDPLGMGPARILISEYGLFENQLGNDATWRSQAVLSTAKNAGLYGAFLWDVYDNSCVGSDGQPDPVDLPLGNAQRPTNTQCRGLWVVRPDGSTSDVLNVLKQYW